jgi:hypothetical protein
MHQWLASKEGFNIKPTTWFENLISTISKKEIVQKSVTKLKLESK